MKSWILGLFLLCLAAPLATADPAPLWFHIKVVEEGEDAETVKVNLPIKLVADVLPHIDSGDFSRGKLHFGRDGDEADIRALLLAAREAEDGEYITVDSRDEKVRVFKQDDHMLIEAEEWGEEREKVRVRLHMDVLDALLSAGPHELNVQAALEVIGRQGPSDLITVEEEDSTVRIWVDDRKTID